MRVIGICRFSYPAVGGFKRMHDTVADREVYLYAPARMDLRFRHFECLTLPSIAAQQHPDFTFLVMIGDSLPKRYRDRLHDLTAHVPQIKIIESEPMKHRLAMQIAIKTELGEDTVPSMQFRLDDDDAVAISFVRSLRWFEKHTRTMRKNWPHMAIDYNRGYSVTLSDEGIKAEEVQPPFWACGLAVLFRPGDDLTVMNFSHHKLHYDMPTLIQPGPHMYLRAKHDDNDSAAKYVCGPMHPLDSREAAFFKSQFNVDEDQVKAVFSDPPSPVD
ncbi:glycosyltransferase [uncultured Roseovarius sp.]|uniref:glycosyltransferase n=1 Tax=uncultured Roseovarius sp. TaxID=293344 RepID=UPI00261F104F|nr:glycosyltransferase [uncultured Roseovarius sp.]